MATYISTALSEDRKRVIVWERNSEGRYPVKYDAPYYFFVPSKDGNYRSVTGQRLSKEMFENPYDFYEARKRYIEESVNLYESDISAELKVLSDNYYNKEVDQQLHITFYDIEVDYDPRKGHGGTSNPYAKISSIALYHVHSDIATVLAVPPKKGRWNDCTLEDLPEHLRDKNIVICKNEKELLIKFFEEINDSDVVSGWNSEFFDDPYIYLRTAKVLGENATNLMNFEYAESDVRVSELENYGKLEITVKPIGRIWIDYMRMVEKFDAIQRSSYALESVAAEELEDVEKLDFGKSLYALYHEDFDKFIEYNIRDTEILKRLEEKFKYMNLAIQFTHMVTNHMQSVLGTVSTSDTAILNFCKYETETRFCLPDATRNVEDDGNNEKFTGALVLEPQIGLHEMIGSVDIKSLYPSTMRAINISPDTLVGQFFEADSAYEAIITKSETDKITILYENEMNDTFTGEEWYELIRKNDWALSAHGTVFTQKKEGIIPAILTSWFESRIEMQQKKKEYAELLKTVKKGSSKYKEYKTKLDYYDNIQYLKKIQLNSMYGVFGNKYFRFFDTRLAESTTKTGQAILLHMAKKIAEVMDGEYAYPSQSTIYGDTDSVYFLTNADDTDSAITVADTMAKVINKSYPKFLQHHFNCINDRENYIIAEREIVSDKGIFVKKRHYLLHLVNKDGYEVDEMKVMGLQIKKTSIPKHIRTFVTKSFERFLKGEDWLTIRKDIVEFKKQLKEGNILEIGKPTGVKGVEKYTEMFNNKEQVSVGHVKASILYNICLNEYGDGESFEIRSGMKIKVFYFYPQKKFGKFTSIALPTDLDLIPDWFEHFKKYIDADKQISVLVDKPVKNILDAIGESVPTAKNVMADDIFEFGI